MSAAADAAVLEKDLLDWVREWTEEDQPEAEIDAETDLSHSGLLDSMGLVALISYLEDQSERTFDFRTFDADSVASVRNLVRHCLTA